MIEKSGRSKRSGQQRPILRAAPKAPLSSSPPCPKDGARKVRNTRYVLRLYVTGCAPKSLRAIQNIAKICEDYLSGRYELKVIDLYQQPKLAADDQIIATPTLVKVSPQPARRVVGDLSDTMRVLAALDLLYAAI